MKVLSVLMIFVSFGCSQIRPQSHVAMELPFAPELVEKIQKSPQYSQSSMSDEFSLDGKSPRRVYFTAMYHQYLALGQYLDLGPEIHSCPQFHHDKVETDSAILPTLALYQNPQVSRETRDFFPELAFSKKFSIKDHYQNLLEEINLLCEEGVSDNYYKFDNLVTHFASKASFHQRPDSMKSVLKIPVFANYYLLKMLQSPHGISFVHPEEKRVIDMTQTFWFEKYVQQAQQMRGHLIKNQMVKR